jgi:hypothetical protein
MSAEGQELWRAFADSHGVSLVALLDAMALVLPPPDSELDPRMVAVIEQAREIDAMRRKRG